MPYPNSPFEVDFQPEILLQHGNVDTKTVKAIQSSYMDRLQSWLCTSPNNTTIRVNTLKTRPETVKKLIDNHILEVLGANNGICTRIDSRNNDTIIIDHSNNQSNIKQVEKEVIVDEICGSAILRGAHLYAPGVIGMMSSIQTDDTVSIFVDTTKTCKKGYLKQFQGPKVLIANGQVKLNRSQLFTENPHTGIAVKIIENTAGCPPLGDSYLPPGVALLQNFPSIVCIRVLDPKPGEKILDMCAAPGNKTTHISALMQNLGQLVAIDKTPRKVAQLQKKCDEFGAKVEVHQADSGKIQIGDQFGLFEKEYFHRILLDAPCSALGKRPQIATRVNLRVLSSFVPLQRKLFEKAVTLLQCGGTLVYSTCTITLGENEGVVAWALKKFPIELVQADPMYGEPGLGLLTGEQLKLVQRFGPEQETDSVGFFIAKFIKK